jgi:hypothetical protein
MTCIDAARLAGRAISWLNYGSFAWEGADVAADFEVY